LRPKVREAILSLALASLVLAPGCGGLAGPIAPGAGAVSGQSLPVTAADVTLFTEPDAGVAPIVSAIAGAKSSVDLEIYMLSNPDVISALIAAAARRVKVRVMMEPNPYNPEKPGEPLKINRETAEKLKGTGVRYAWTDPQFRFTHSKTMVIDRAVGYIMTLNLTKSGTTRNREFAAIDSDKSDVRDLVRLFESDWSHVAFAPRSKRLVVSPVNAQEKLSALIAGANRSLVVYDEILYDTATQNLLGAKARAGVDVKVLMGDPVTVPDNAVAADRMKRMGVQVKYLTLPVVHAKMIVADSMRGYIGSVNLTTTSLLRNREVGIILSGSTHLDLLTGTFAKDWSKARDFEPPTPALFGRPPLPGPVEFDRG
jgi:phosphatidylserine/phosphatidylglycerophosphate/cardiolipin synthase-like enzyme